MRVCWICDSQIGYRHGVAIQCEWCTKIFQRFASYDYYQTPRGKEKKRDIDKRYCIKHKEEITKQKRQYYVDNKEKLDKYKLNWRRGREYTFHMGTRLYDTFKKFEEEITNEDYGF